jgi:hypothetical protein
MERSQGEARYLAGYDAGRAACLRAGSADAARRWAAEHQHVDPAYLAGYEWALWDYEDANGVPRRHASGG